MSHGIRYLKTRKAKDGSTLYYYQADGKQMPLPVATLEEARARIEWLVENSNKSFKGIAEKYRKEHLPAIAPSSRVEYNRHLNTLIPAFGHLALDEIEPMLVRQYLDRRSKKIAANREVGVLSHLWNWSREKGLTKLANPCTGITRNKQKARERYVTDAEYQAVWDKADPILRDALELMLLTGQRPSDVLKMTRQDVRDGHLWVRQGKTGTKLGIEVVGELAATLQRILASPKAIPSMYLVADEQGQPLNIVQLDKRYGKVRCSDWQLRDLRAKVATESPDLTTAQRLLGHRDETTTARIYRRVRGNMVKPLR